MTGPDPPPLGPAPDLRQQPSESGDSASFASRLALAHKAGGLVVPLLTTVLANIIHIHATPWVGEVAEWPKATVC